LLRENSGIRFTLHKVFFLRIYYKVSSTFQTTSLNSRLSGDTIFIHMDVMASIGNDYDALFNISSTSTTLPIPETSGFLSLTAGFTAILAYRRRQIR